MKLTALLEANHVHPAKNLSESFMDSVVDKITRSVRDTKRKVEGRDRSVGSSEILTILGKKTRFRGDAGHLGDLISQLTEIYGLPAVGDDGHWVFNSGVIRAGPGKQKIILIHMFLNEQNNDVRVYNEPFPYMGGATSWTGIARALMKRDVDLW